MAPLPAKFATQPGPNDPGAQGLYLQVRLRLRTSYPVKVSSS
jgi:hypothetical protein